VSFGFPVGPITLLDEVGIDVGAHVAKDLGAAFESRGLGAPASLETLVKAGILGRKSGRGFYRYPKDAPKRAKKEVDDGIYAFFGGAVRKQVPEDDLVDRTVLAMVNEAAHALHEGVVASARDADTAAVLGLGFPPFRGGPFRFVDSVGARAVVAKLERLAGTLGPRFAPAPALVEKAGNGELFHPVES